MGLGLLKGEKGDRGAAGQNATPVPPPQQAPQPQAPQPQAPQPQAPQQRAPQQQAPQQQAWQGFARQRRYATRMDASGRRWEATRRENRAATAPQPPPAPQAPPAPPIFTFGQQQPQAPPAAPGQQQPQAPPAAPGQQQPQAPPEAPIFNFAQQQQDAARASRREEVRWRQTDRRAERLAAARRRPVAGAGA
ncbi:unnamed protein product [Ectocarpus sp. 12 AP-2014]